MKRFLLLLPLLIAMFGLRAQTDITFCVDMTSVASVPGFAAQAIAFDFNSFNSGSTPLTNMGGNIFCGTFDLADGEVRFNFFYAGANGAGGGEDLDPLDGEPCVSSGSGGIKRTYTVVNGQTETVSFVWETCDAILPVELVNFSGEALTKVNRFYWTTASEENVEWHILERNSGGHNSWEEVARSASSLEPRTQGASLGTEEQRYSLDDEAPLLSAYYRLRSVDYDGSEDISPVLMLERATAGVVLRAYPNPAGNRLEVLLNSSEVSTASLYLLAADGREIFSDNRKLEEGPNNLSLNLSTVPAGIYFLRVGEQVLRVVKR